MDALKSMNVRNGVIFVSNSYRDSILVFHAPMPVPQMLICTLQIKFSISESNGENNCGLWPVAVVCEVSEKMFLISTKYTRSITSFDLVY